MRSNNISHETVFLRVIANSIKETAAYRVNHVLSFLVILLPLIFASMLWTAVFAGGTSMMNGYSKSTIITYYVLCILLFDVLYPGLNYSVSADIRDGKLSNLLIKPVSYLTYNFAMKVGLNLVYLLSSLLLACIFVLLFIKSFYFPPAARYLPFLLAVLLAFMLSYLISFSLSLTAFWTEETTWLQTLIDILVPFTTGALIPLAFFPKTLVTVIYLTPFPYIINFPLDVYLGNKSGGPLLHGFLMQALWLGALYFVQAGLWRHGLRRYQACGG